MLDRALAHLAAVAARDLGADRSREPGAGAAGGLGFGLLAFAGARLRRGVEVVMEAVGFQERLAAASVVVTGEGAFDAGSLHGKVPAGVLQASALAGVPVAVLCGVASADAPGAVVRSLVDLVGRGRALADAPGSLERLAAGARRGGTRALRSSRMTPAQPIRSGRRTRPRGEGSQPSPVTI